MNFTKSFEDTGYKAKFIDKNKGKIILEMATMIKLRAWNLIN